MSVLTTYSTRLLAGSVLVILATTACVRDEQSPGYEYMPDMYRSPAIEAYVDYGEIRDTIHDELATTKSVRRPVEGTVPFSDQAMNDIPFTIPNTFEGYESAGEILKSPLAETEDIIREGQLIYADFCVHCHGKTGKGDGPVVEMGGHPPPPAYDSPQMADLPEGKMFHAITYGKGLMGPHKSQLSKLDRWKVIAFVKTLQASDDEGEAENDNQEENAEEGTSEN